MLYNYGDCIKKYDNKYNLDKAIAKGEVYKIEKGIYSDKKHVSELAIISYKNKDAVFTKDSAYFYHQLTDHVPDKYYLATRKDDYKIIDKRIAQVFYLEKQFYFGITEIEYEKTKIRIYDKERMLVELARNKNKMPYDYYKEIIKNYRKIQDALNMHNIYSYSKNYVNSNSIMRVLLSEVF